MTRVSVIMPVYNSEKYVGEAIESILNQTYEDFELIIIDDGSKDSSAEIIQSYKDERIVFIKNEVNRGFLYNLNYGIEISKGEYIARLDNDDISYPTRFEKQVQFLDSHPETVLVGTKMDLLIDGKKRDSQKVPLETEKEIKFSLLFGNYCIAHSSFMMRKSVFTETNLTYNTFIQTPDYHMLLDMSLRGDVSMIPEPLIAWRIHSAQSTSVRPARMRLDEEDRTRYLYINELALSDGEKAILKKGTARGLENREEYREFQKAMISYAKLCNMPVDRKSLKSNKLYKFVFAGVMRKQKCCRELLAAYLKSPFRDFKQLFFTYPGLIMFAKCLVNRDKNWMGPAEEMK